MIPPRGCAYIVMVHRQDANRALQKLSRGNFKVNQKSIKVLLGKQQLSKAGVILSHLCWALGCFRLTCVLEMILGEILKKCISELVFENYCSWSMVGLMQSCVSVLERLFNQQKGCPFAHYKGLALCVSCCQLSPYRVSLHIIILQRVLINKEICIN